MSLTLNIKNLDKTLAEVASYSQRVNNDINNEFVAFGAAVVKEAKELAPVNEGRLRQNIASEASNLRVAISANVSYAPYIEFGTKAFAEAYVSSLPAEWQALAAESKEQGDKGTFAEMLVSIKEWVRLKGIATGKDIDQAAYVIAKSILIKGIRPQPFLFPAYEHQIIELIKNLKSAINAK